jgi:hypothetical protein
VLIAVRSSRSAAGGAVPWLTLIVATALLVGCTLSRPDRVIEPDVVGLVTATHRPSLDQPMTVELGDRSLQIDKDAALDLTGPGISPGVLLLYGEDGGRTWHVTAAVRETSPTPGCYTLRGDAAFDAPGAVLFVFLERGEVGLRLPKRADFVAPPGVVSSQTGQYIVGQAGELAVFCLDPDGALFGMT